MSLNNSGISESTSSIVNIDFPALVKNQYMFKWNANMSMFSTMILLQVIAMLFSFMGQSMGFGTNNVSINVNIFTADIIIIFTMIWAFMMGINLTAKPAKNMMFTFVTDKKSNHIANLLFMITMSVIGGVTAFLLGYVMKALAFVLIDGDKLVYAVKASLGIVSTSILVTVLYLLLFSVVGYVIGEFVQLNKMFAVLIPVLLVGFFITLSMNNNEQMFANILEFYVSEKNILFFLMKIMGTSAFLFLVATFIGRRLEVRR